jgi:hypothetical protein
MLGGSIRVNTFTGDCARICWPQANTMMGRRGCRHPGKIAAGVVAGREFDADAATFAVFSYPRLITSSESKFFVRRERRYPAINREGLAGPRPVRRLGVAGLLERHIVHAQSAFAEIAAKADIHVFDSR